MEGLPAVGDVLLKDHSGCVGRTNQNGKVQDQSGGSCHNPTNC